jgi:hypothetical protein
MSSGVGLGDFFLPVPRASGSGISSDMCTISAAGVGRSKNTSVKVAMRPCRAQKPRPGTSFQLGGMGHSRCGDNSGRDAGGKLCASSSAKGHGGSGYPLVRPQRTIPSSRPESLRSAARKRRQGWPSGHRRRRREATLTARARRYNHRVGAKGLFMRPAAAPPSCVRASAPC